MQFRQLRFVCELRYELFNIFDSLPRIIHLQQILPLRILYRNQFREAPSKIPKVVIVDYQILLLD